MNITTLKIVSGYLLICLLWGSTWLAIRFGLDSLTPFFSAGVRFALASAFVYGLAKIRKLKIQTDPISMKLYFLLGIFSFVIPFGLVYWSEQYIPSGLASVLFAIFPFSVIIFSKLMIREQPVSGNQIIGAILGFAGILVIFSDDIVVDIGLYFWGMLAVVLSASIQGFIAVTIKKQGRHLHPLTMNFVPLLIAGVVMIAAGWSFEDTAGWRFDSNAILSISYLAFFGTVITFTTYYWLMQQINVVILSLTAFITPIIAVLLGFLVIGEKLSLNDLLGGLFVLSGILSANLKGLLKYYKSKGK